MIPWADAIPLPLELIFIIDKMKRQMEFNDVVKVLEQKLQFPEKDQNTRNLIFRFENDTYHSLFWVCPTIDTEPPNEFYPLDIEMYMTVGLLRRVKRGGLVVILPTPRRTYHTVWYYDLLRLDPEPHIKPFLAPEFQFTEVWK
jgi:hypothetical protein